MVRDAAPSALPIAATDWRGCSPAPDRTGRAARIAARKSRWRGSPAPDVADTLSRAFSRATRTESGSMSLASTVLVQRLRRGDRQHAGAGAEIEHAPRAAAPSARDRAAAGSRAWCRDGRCRTPAPPRSRCRACWAAPVRGHAGRARRSARRGTGTRSSRLALTQSLASTVSKTMVSRDILAGGAGHQLAHQRLVRRLGKMHGDVPAPVRPLERGDRGLALEENSRSADRQRVWRPVRRRSRSWRGGWRKPWKSL